jgi:hypothetical protein
MLRAATQESDAPVKDGLDRMRSRVAQMPVIVNGRVSEFASDTSGRVAADGLARSGAAR